MLAELRPDQDQMVQVMAEYKANTVNTKDLANTFKTKYNEGVYRFSLKRWGGHPHFSQAYYDENTKVLALTAMTDRGFHALVDGLNVFMSMVLPDIRIYAET